MQREGSILAQDSFGPRLAQVQGTIALVQSPFAGALAVRAVLTDARHFYVTFIAVTALVGLFVGLLSQPGSALGPQALNTIWIVVWTLGGAWIGTLWRRSTPYKWRLASIGGTTLFFILVPAFVDASASRLTRMVSSFF